MADIEPGVLIIDTELAGCILASNTPVIHITRIMGGIPGRERRLANLGPFNRSNRAALWRHRTRSPTLRSATESGVRRIGSDR